MSSKQIRTVCPRDCYDSCHVVAEFSQGQDYPRLTGDVQHPVTQGFTCPRGAKDIERALSTQRVLFPHIREKSTIGERGRRSSWDEALQLITNQLNKTIKSDGAEAVLHLEYAGNTGLLTWYYPQRIWNALGATKTDNSICSKAGHDALALHYGSTQSPQPEDLRNQKLIVFWGFNAAVSSPHMWRLARLAREQNQATIAAIDPRVSDTVKHADFHLQPNPDSDVALVYGIARDLIEHDHVNSEFIAEWTLGFERFRQEAMKWTPKRVEKITGIPRSQIEQFIELYSSLKPSVLMIGLGMLKSLNGAEAVRAVGLLPALIGLHRGFFYSNGKAYPVDYEYLTGESLTPTPHRVVSQVGLGQLVANGEFKFIYIYNMNPALTLPNQVAFRKGLLREEVFVVVHDTHWSETTNYANVVLPAATFLEKEDVVIPWSHHYVQKSNQILESQGESRTEVWVMQELARRLDQKERWLYQHPWQAVETAIKGALADGSFRDIQQGKRLHLKSKNLNEYPTSSGKIEFVSSTAQELGLPPLPVQPSPQPAQGEFVLLNSALRKYTHTQFQDIYGTIPAIVYIHSQDAKILGIQEDEPVHLNNSQGTVQVYARISDAVPPGVLWSPRQLVGLDHNPQNCLIPDTRQTIGNGPVFNSTRVRIQKARTA